MVGFNINFFVFWRVRNYMTETYEQLIVEMNEFIKKLEEDDNNKHLTLIRSIKEAIEYLLNNQPEI